MSRRARLLASTILACLLLAGCGSGPSQAGAAAIVGDSRIPLERVQSIYKEALREQAGLKQKLQQQGRMDDFGRDVVSITVQHELVEQTARKAGVSVDERRVNQAINQQGGAQHMSTVLRDMIRMRLLAVELGRKYLDSTSVTFDYVQANTRREAEAKARRMAQGPEEAAAVLDAETKAGQPVFRDQRVHAAESPSLATQTPLFGAGPGTVLAFEVQLQSARWIIARIKDRSTNAATPAPTAARTDETTLQAFGMRLAGVTVDQVGVRLSPRYGVWDQVGMMVARNEDQAQGFWFTGPEDLSS